MKLVHPNLSGEIIKNDCYFSELVVESPILFMKYVKELLDQSNGLEGDFVLSKGDEIINISRKVEVVVNPFSINVNDKKVINKLYLELIKIANDGDMYLKTNMINQNIIEYLLVLEQNINTVLKFNNSIDLSSLFKSVNLKFDISFEDNSFLENVIKYIEILNEILGIDLFVFVNLKSYLEEEKINMIKKEAYYKQINILLIDDSFKYSNDSVNCYIIDSDKCEIY